MFIECMLKNRTSIVYNINVTLTAINVSYLGKNIFHFLVHKIVYNYACGTFIILAQKVIILIKIIIHNWTFELISNRLTRLPNFKFHIIHLLTINKQRGGLNPMNSHSLEYTSDLVNRNYTFNIVTQDTAWILIYGGNKNAALDGAMVQT